jgi:hypothetical protein
MSSIEQWSPFVIELHDTPFARDVAVQRTRLEQEGQIEPLVLRNGRIDPDNWPYGDAQVVAARQLCWDTLLVVELGRSRHDDSQ